MPTSYTGNAKLGIPAVGDRTWNLALANDLQALDGFTALGALCCTTHEQPSSSLLFDVAPGTFRIQDGSSIVFGGVVGQALAANSTVVIYLDGLTSWFTVYSAASYPTDPHVKIATVVTGASTITSITDNRQCVLVAGSIQDGTKWSIGLTAGLQIGITSNQSLGFYGATPIARSTVGSAVATSSWTTVEAGMLNRIYAAFRSLGLGS
jgi:hypothetical protein